MVPTETFARPHPRGERRHGAVVIAALLSLAACQRDRITHYRVPKEAEPMAMAPSAASSAGGLRWTLPAGWKEAEGGGQMRYATLTAPVPGKLDVSVVRLPGPAGGELANVNRWRNQLGLPPLSEAELGAARTTVRSAAGDLAVYDFSSGAGGKSRTIAGLASIEGETWFVKMTGEAEAVAAARAPFLELLGSLRRDPR